MKRLPHKRPRILLGITGSVAAVKGPELALRLFKELDADVIVVLTRTGERFWDLSKLYNECMYRELEELLMKQETVEVDDTATSLSLSSHNVSSDSTRLHHINNNLSKDDDDDEDISRTLRIYRYNDEWIGLTALDDSYKNNHRGNTMVIWEHMGDPILHIQLRNWADLALVAPLSAHTLAKISNGFCDDLLSCTLRAWDFSNRDTDTGSLSRPGLGKPIILAPAMNTAMWDHPITRKQLDNICNMGKDISSNTLDHNTSSSCVRVIEPQVKKLACGDYGKGALADVSDILDMTKECLPLWFPGM